MEKETFNNPSHIKWKCDYTISGDGTAGAAPTPAVPLIVVTLPFDVGELSRIGGHCPNLVDQTLTQAIYGKQPILPVEACQSVSECTG